MSFIQLYHAWRGLFFQWITIKMKLLKMCALNYPEISVLSELPNKGAEEGSAHLWWTEGSQRCTTVSLPGTSALQPWPLPSLWLILQTQASHLSTLTDADRDCVLVNSLAEAATYAFGGGARGGVCCLHCPMKISAFFRTFYRKKKRRLQLEVACVGIKLHWWCSLSCVHTRNHPLLNHTKEQS